MLSTVDEADRAAAEHFPSQDDMDAAMDDFLKQLEQEVTFDNLRAKALRDGHLKSFDMRESSRDGDQDLHMYLRDIDIVIRELIGDPRMAGTLLYTSV